VGDEVVVEGPDGQSRRYLVASTHVVDRRDLWVTTDAGDTRLTLVTCYPFDAIRPGGPLRYVVVARSTGTTQAVLKRTDGPETD
jgi:sortase A